jgi:hypothetical protein
VALERAGDADVDGQHDRLGPPAMARTSAAVQRCSIGVWTSMTWPLIEPRASPARFMARPKVPATTF